MKASIEAKKPVRAEDFQLEDFLPFRLSIAADFVSRLIARQYLAQTGLGMSEWRLLAAVGRFGTLSPTAAGERTSMDKVKVSRAAASLVAKGLLRQNQDPEDGRGRLLRLTRKGTTSFAAVGSTASAIETSLAAGLSKAEWNALHKALGTLVEHTRSLLADSGDVEAG